MDKSNIERGATIGVAQLTLHLSMLLFALIAGFFYAYSVDVMRGLDLIKPNSAIEAMQSINLEVKNPVFFVTFFLTPILALLAAFLLKKEGNKKSAYFIMVAAVVYILGAFLPTILVNVPMNEALALVKLENNQADTIWNEYSPRWTTWNTIRTVFSSISVLLVSFSIAFSKYK